MSFFTSEDDENGCPLASGVLCNVELNNFDVDIHGRGMG